MPFVLVPARRFWMGGGGGKPGDRQVVIPEDFYLAQYPVTQSRWLRIMGSNPSRFAKKGARLAQFPVEQVSWNDLQQFLKQLNAQVKESDWMYRLPTEAEWE